MAASLRGAKKMSPAPEPRSGQTRDELAVLGELRRRRGSETHPAVSEDLDILIDVLEGDLELTRAEERLLLPYFDVAEVARRFNSTNV